MGNVNPSYFDRVRYTLRSKHLDPIIITEPIGWNDDDKEFARHEKYHGIIAKFSNSLKFIGSGKNYIQFIYDVYGINEEIELIRHEKHPETDDWVLSYSGFLDLSTWTTENNQVSVKFNSGGLEQLLKARESDQVEIDRLTTIDGKPIPPISPITVNLDGRRIFLKSKWELKAPNNSGEVYIESDAGNTRHQSVGVPFKLVNQSHENAHSVIIQTTGSENVGSTGMMFYANSDRVRTLDINLNFTFKFNVFQEDIQWAWFNINLTRYSGGIAYSPAQRITIFSLPNKDSIFGSHERTFSVSWQGQITVNVGDSLAIEALEKADLGGPGHAYLQCQMVNMQGEMIMDEDSFQEQTTAKALLAHELGDRLVTIATGKENAFYSDFLGRTDIGYPVDGKGSLTGFTHGFWVRGFDKLPIPSEGPPKVENMFKPLTTSPKDFFESMNVVWNTGIGIEKVGFTERVRLEPLSYFYNNNVTIKIGQVKNVKRSVVTDKYYSSLEFGYDKGGEYEEACGLDEYNAKATFTTVIDRIKNTYSKISKYRADSYGMEFTRRKQKTLNDTEDTSMDNHIWFLDLKRGLTSIFIQRKYQDDFSQIPTGVFSPETATNLRFSPANIMLRHSWWFSGAFVKYATDYLRYGSSTANSKLKTKLRTDLAYSNNPNNTPGNGNEYSENGNVVNSEFQRARFVPEEIEFERECDFSMMQMINGKTNILGKDVPNVYGLVEFINENNVIERGFLMNLKPNGKGQWKLLKANR